MRFWVAQNVICVNNVYFFGFHIDNYRYIEAKMDEQEKNITTEHEQEIEVKKPFVKRHKKLLIF